MVGTGIKTQEILSQRSNRVETAKDPPAPANPPMPATPEEMSAEDAATKLQAVQRGNSARNVGSKATGAAAAPATDAVAAPSSAPAPAAEAPAPAAEAPAEENGGFMGWLTSQMSGR